MRSRKREVDSLFSESRSPASIIPFFLVPDCLLTDKRLLLVIISAGMVLCQHDPRRGVFLSARRSPIERGEYCRHRDEGDYQ